MSKEHTMQKLREKYTQELQTNPWALWAKKFDTVVHIPVTQRLSEKISGTCCGSVAALLGNNYAPEKTDLPVCEDCLKVKCEEILRLVSN